MAEVELEILTLCKCIILKAKMNMIHGRVIRFMNKGIPLNWMDFNMCHSSAFLFLVSSSLPIFVPESFYCRLHTWAVAAMIKIEFGCQRLMMT